MKLEPIATDEQSLTACAKLLSAAFPGDHHHTAAYLNWLYCENPVGMVVGFNAWERDKIVGHYAALPVELYLDGYPTRGLLALHTAIHPDFRNTGIIYSLAKKTCNAAREQDFACIYAVANAASTPIFTKAMGFQLVQQLSASLGIAAIRPNWRIANNGNRFRRRWRSDTMRWRSNNPVNRTQILPCGDHGMAFYASTHIPGIRAYGLLQPEDHAPATGNRIGGVIRLFLGVMPEASCTWLTYFKIPERLKPSPLNLIYLPLNNSIPQVLAANEVILGIQDFDPY
ncbi:MAG: GNAT family N-acetyltransferase [Pseudomonadota bacterium]